MMWTEEHSDRFLKRGNYAEAEATLNMEIRKRFHHMNSYSEIHNLTLDRMQCMEEIGDQKDVSDMVESVLQNCMEAEQDALDEVDKLRGWYEERYGKSMEISKKLRERMEASVKAMTQMLKSSVEPQHKKRKIVEGRPKCLDPFAKTTGLPLEVIQLIIEKLYWRDIENACQVSPNWNELVLKYSSMLRSVNFGMNIGTKEVRKYGMACSRVGVKNVSWVRFCDLTAGQEPFVVKELGNYDLHIETLEIDSYSDMNFDELDQWDPPARSALDTIQCLKLRYRNTYGTNLQPLITRLRHLHELEITIYSRDGTEWPPIPELVVKDLQKVTLTFGDDYDCDDETIRRYIESCKFTNVNEIVFEKVTRSDSFGTLFASAKPKIIRLRQCPIAWQSLYRDIGKAGIFPSVLEMSGLDNCPTPFEFFHPPEFPGLDHLTHIQLGQQKAIPWHCLSRMILPTKGNLDELSLVSNKDIFDSESMFTFAELFKLCPSVRSLLICRCPGFDDKRCRELAEAVDALKEPKLRVLRVSCESLTAEGSECLSSLHLDLLQLSGASGISHVTVMNMRENGRCREVKAYT